MIAFLAGLIFFVVGVVIVILLVQWAMSKVQLDATLKYIIYLFIFLIMFAVFLRVVGVWGGGPMDWRMPH